MSSCARDLKIRYLIFDAFGVGGTVRTVLNVANYLVGQGYDVEIASVMRWREKPFFPVDPRIGTSVLNDARSRQPRRWLDWSVLAGVGARLVTGSRLIHPDDEAYQVFSRLTDVRLRRYLGSIRSGVLITTRPSLNLASGEHVSAGVIKIGQEHLCHANHPARLQRAIQNNYQRLDAVVTLTEGDAREYKDVLGRSSTTILTIPNAIPQMRGVSTALDENVIIAVGRFVPQKGFDLLIEAFQQVVARHPNWKLKIFGSGPDKHMLQRMIAERGIQAHAFLMEPATAIEDEYARASICAVSSRWEGFPMIVVEAMSCGLPVVSFDCPSGPGEIIHHGEDGLLVEKENIGAFAHALIDLIEDPPRRKQLGRRARASVRRFGIDLIGRQWTDLIEALRSKRSRCRSAASVVC